MGVREIERIGDHPGFVQVSLPVRSEAPYGNRRYLPIFEAAARHNLVVSLQFGGAPGNPPTGAGWPSYYVEEYVGMAEVFQTQVLSLIVEGVFEEFPTLRFALIEGGFGWVPYVAGRLDRLYPALKREVPYLKRLPSEYVRGHFYFSTQPVEEPPDPRHFQELFAMADGAHRVMFASDYPHWDFDNPLTVLHHLPPDVRRRVCVDNVLDCYGPRLLAPSR